MRYAHGVMSGCCRSVIVIIDVEVGRGVDAFCGLCLASVFLPRIILPGKLPLLPEAMGHEEWRTRPADLVAPAAPECQTFAAAGEAPEDGEIDALAGRYAAADLAAEDLAERVFAFLWMGWFNLRRLIVELSCRLA